MQFLYDSGEPAVFMDNQSYDQVEIPKSVVGDASSGCRRTPTSTALRRRAPGRRAAGERGRPERHPDRPGLKGDTASGGGTKPATLETGVTVQVPLFIEEGREVRVDTRSGEYVSRA
jgi:elongation factor P